MTSANSINIGRLLPQAAYYAALRGTDDDRQRIRDKFDRMIRLRSGDSDPVAEALRENIITSLRRKTPQILITYLAQEETASHQDLSTVAEVSPQAITFHTQKLTSCGILESRKDGRQKFYSLSDEARQITEALVFGPRG